jgi:hypothetical protein
MARSRRRITLDDYAWERIDDLHESGGQVRGMPFVSSTDGGSELQILATVDFDYLSFQMLEVVVISHGRPHRRKYSYHCMDGDELVFRYDRDPEGHPRMPEHKHVGPSGRRTRTGPVRLRDVIDEIWEHVHRHWNE